MSPYPIPKHGGRVVEDRPCPSCGYNLRGLRSGVLCPECGHGALRSTTLTPPRPDLWQGEQAGSRTQWEAGFLMLTIALAVALVGRVAYFVLAAPGASTQVQLVYVFTGAGNAVLWVAAVWLVTPVSIDRRWPRYATLRTLARWGSLAWLFGYACLVGRYLTSGSGPIHDWLLLGDYAGRLAGGLGVMILAFLLHTIALDADLFRAGWRFNACVWLLWFPTLLAQAFGGRIAWFTLIPLGIVLFFWCWLMVLYTLGAYELYQHLRWMRRHVVESVDRDARVAEKRRAIETATAAAVRPVPIGEQRDVGLDE